MLLTRELASVCKTLASSKQPSESHSLRDHRPEDSPRRRNRVPRRLPLKNFAKPARNHLHQSQTEHTHIYAHLRTFHAKKHDK